MCTLHHSSVSQKNAALFLNTTLANFDRFNQHSVTVGFHNKFAARYFPPYLKPVTTLPYKTFAVDTFDFQHAILTTFVGVWRPSSVFVDSGVKINGTYCHDVLLTEQPLPVMHEISGEFCFFQQDCDRAHWTGDRISFWHGRQQRSLHQTCASPTVRKWTCFLFSFWPDDIFLVNTICVSNLKCLALSVPEIRGGPNFKVGHVPFLNSLLFGFVEIAFCALHCGPTDGDLFPILK